MSETVNLPELGESVTEGTVTRWLKEVGDRVEVDEPLVEVSTDKVDTEIPSPVAGVIEEILANEDDTIDVGAPLVKIGDGDGSSNDGSSQDAAQQDSADQADSSTQDSSEDASDDAAAEQGSSDSQPAASGEDSSGDSASETPAASSGSGEGTEVKLPELGESVTEGTITRWLKEVGDQVEVDEPLLEVSTDKVDTEIPSPVAGTLQEIKAGEDDTVEVGAVLAIVGEGAGQGSSDQGGSSEPASQPQESSQAEDSDAAPEQSGESDDASAKDSSAQQDASDASQSSSQATQEQAAPKQEGSQATGAAEAASAQGTAGGYVTPIVRKLAHENGVDLDSVKGTGVGGRIRKQDVQQAIEAKKSAPAPAAAASGSQAPAAAKAAPSAEAAKLRGTTVKAPRIRQVIAKRMRESLEVSAQLTQVQEVDMTSIVRLRKQAKASFAQNHGVNLTYLPFISLAVTEALRQFPAFNASYDEETQQITYHDAEHLGMAVDTERGLLVPVISDAGDLNLAGFAKKIADVGERARTNKLGPEELAGSTFTITNIGSAGALFDTPILNQPNVGILGTGLIQKRPAVIQDADGEDAIAIRHLMYLSLTYDHRLVDGANAGRFLGAIKARLEGAQFGSELGL